MKFLNLQMSIYIAKIAEPKFTMIYLDSLASEYLFKKMFETIMYIAMYSKITPTHPVVNISFICLPKYGCNIKTFKYTPISIEISKILMSISCRFIPTNLI